MRIIIEMGESDGKKFSLGMMHDGMRGVGIYVLFVFSLWNPSRGFWGVGELRAYYFSNNIRGCR